MSKVDVSVALRAGEYLSRQAVSSPSGEYSLFHRPDGNVVVCRTWDAGVVWSADTAFQPDSDGSAGRLLLTADGCLVVERPGHEPVWLYSAEHGPGSRLELLDIGGLQLRTSEGYLVWRQEPLLLPRPWMGWSLVGDGTRLLRGQTLRNGSITSAAGTHVFTVDETGSGRLWRRDGGLVDTFIGRDWAGGLVFSANGLLQWCGSSGGDEPYLDDWSDGAARDAVEFRVTDDGHVVLLDERGQVLWSRPKPVRKRVRPSQVERAAVAVPAMPEVLLRTEASPLIRTDFSDDAAWQWVQQRVRAQHGSEGFQAHVTAVDDPAFEGYTAEQLHTALPLDAEWSVAFAADAMTFASPEQSLLVMELTSSVDDEENENEDEGEVEDDENATGWPTRPGMVRTFRAIPRSIQSIENNLNLANMDWPDFAQAVDEDGVHREDCWCDDPPNDH